MDTENKRTTAMHKVLTEVISRDEEEIDYSDQVKFIVSIIIWDFSCFPSYQI